MRSKAVAKSKFHSFGNRAGWILSLSLAFGLTAFAEVSRQTSSIPKTQLKDLVPLPSFKNWGLMNSEGRSHINAPSAWKMGEGSRKVIVAVIDTGLDVQHPDLKANVWKDPKSATPVYGWDFVRNRANPTDEHGHGTHVSGIIGAVANPKTGTSGVAHLVSIMPIKYYSEANPGPVNLANTIKAIDWAVEHGAHIINYSGGGPEFSEAEYLAMKRAEAKGVLVVAAAGNERQNTDQLENYYYPAAYRLSNILSVAATDIRNKLLPSSNWGKNHVDVAAPGEGIYSTLPGNRYGQMSGTSQATAFVTGIAALILSKNPSLKPQEVKKIILSSVDPIPGLKDKVASGGRVNAYQSLLAMSSPSRALPPRAAVPPIKVATRSKQPLLIEASE